MEISQNQCEKHTLTSRGRTCNLVNRMTSPEPNSKPTLNIGIVHALLSKEKEGIYKLEELLTKDIVSTKDICSRCIFFQLKWLPLIGNRTSCCPILSVIILVINKSDSHFAFI